MAKPKHEHGRAPHHGGPGSSHEDATKTPRTEPAEPAPGAPTSQQRSRVSGGGGERDSHHSHDPREKS